MEPFCMKCQKCGQSSPVTMNLSEGEELEIRKGMPAPSTVCICGSVQPISPGTYKGTKEGTVRVSD